MPYKRTADEGDCSYSSNISQTLRLHERLDGLNLSRTPTRLWSGFRFLEEDAMDAASFTRAWRRRKINHALRQDPSEHRARP